MSPLSKELPEWYRNRSRPLSGLADFAIGCLFWAVFFLMVAKSEFSISGYVIVVNGLIFFAILLLCWIQVRLVPLIVRLSRAEWREQLALTFLHPSNYLLESLKQPVKTALIPVVTTWPLIGLWWLTILVYRYVQPQSSYHLIDSVQLLCFILGWLSISILPFAGLLELLRRLCANPKSSASALAVPVVTVVGTLALIFGGLYLTEAINAYGSRWLSPHKPGSGAVVLVIATWLMAFAIVWAKPLRFGILFWIVILLLTPLAVPRVLDNLMYYLQGAEIRMKWTLEFHFTNRRYMAMLVYCAGLCFFSIWLLRNRWRAACRAYYHFE